jgi:hypothetical protein
VHALRDTHHTQNVSTNKIKIMNLNKLLPIIYVIIWISIIFLTPKEVFYSGEGIMRWIIYGGIFLLLPYLLFKSLELTSFSKKIRKGIAYLSIFLGIPFGLWLNIHSEKELKENGKITYGIIEKAWLIVRKSRTDVWSVKAKYIVGDKTFHTSTKENPERTLFVGDTIRIKYSEKTPQISEIIELKNK